METKENGVVWHNIQENPNDLPSEDYTEVLTIAIVTKDEYYYHVFTFIRNDEMAKVKGVSAHFCNWQENRFYPITAWREVPSFEEV